MSDCILKPLVVKKLVDLSIKCNTPDINESINQDLANAISGVSIETNEDGKLLLVELSLLGNSIKDTLVFPTATSQLDGLLSKEDKLNLPITEELKDLNDFTEKGVYYIKGNYVEQINLPKEIEFGTIFVKLVVTPSNNRISQLLIDGNTIFSRFGIEREEYIEHEDYIEHKSYVEWSIWKQLQATTNVGDITEDILDTLKLDGIYKGGLYTLNDQYEVFTLLVISSDERCSQLKYSLLDDGNVQVKKRSSNKIGEWQPWEDLSSSATPDNIVTDKDILIAGLKSSLGNYSNGLSIKAGTSLKTILLNIFTTEIFPSNVKTLEASLKITINNPTITTNTLEREVGTSVTAICAHNGISLTKQNSRIYNMDYGFIQNGENKTAEEISSVCLYNSNGNIMVDSELKSIVLQEGNNTVSFTITSPEYTYTASAITNVYPLSNVGNPTLNDFKVRAINGTVNPFSKNFSKTIEGLYKYFFGYPDKKTSFTSDDIRKLNISGYIEKYGKTTIIGDDINTTNGRPIVVACPVLYKLVSIDYGAVATSLLSEFTGKETVDVTTGTTTTKYDVYILPNNNEAKIEFKNVTLTRNDN